MPGHSGQPVQSPTETDVAIASGPAAIIGPIPSGIARADGVLGSPTVCCAPGEQVTCCAPSEKPGCCGPEPVSGSGCGCR
jgi:hypothetical protein